MVVFYFLPIKIISFLPVSQDLIPRKHICSSQIEEEPRLARPSPRRRSRPVSWRIYWAEKRWWGQGWWGDWPCAAWRGRCTRPPRPSPPSERWGARSEPSLQQLTRTRTPGSHTVSGGLLSVTQSVVGSSQSYSQWWVPLSHTVSGGLHSVIRGLLSVIQSVVGSSQSYSQWWAPLQSCYDIVILSKHLLLKYSPYLIPDLS